MGCIYLKSIIEELYFSNLDFSISSTNTSPNFDTTLDRISHIESQLLELLPDDTCTLFVEYVGHYEALVGMIGLDKFKAGFSLATRIIIESLAANNSFHLDET